MDAAAIRLRRLKLRSWRRGMREMDLILGPFADAELANFSSDELAEYESLLSSNDQELYSWVGGVASPTSAFAPLIERIRAYHGIIERNRPAKR